MPRHPPEPRRPTRSLPPPTSRDRWKDEPAAEQSHGTNSSRYAERAISANAAALAGGNPYAADYAAPDTRLPAALRGR
jgi:hypothetical protein